MKGTRMIASELRGRRTGPGAVLVLALLGGLVGGLAGCHLASDDVFVEPLFDLRGESLLVIPFKQDELWYYESPRGERLVRELSLALQDSCNGNLVSDAIVAREVLENFEDPPPLVRWGQRSGASHVLVGEIAGVHFSKTNVVGMVQGTMSFKYQVWNVATGKQIYENRAKAVFPKDPSRETSAVFERDEDQVFDRVVKRAVDIITTQLCGKWEDPLDRIE